MESAKIQKWLPETSSEDDEFHPFVAEPTQAESSFASDVALVQPASRFKLGDSSWQSLLADAAVREEFDARVREAVLQRLQTDLAKEKAEFYERTRLEAIAEARSQMAAEYAVLSDKVEALCAEIVRGKQELLEGHQTVWVALLRHLLHRFLVPSSTKLSTEVEKWLAASLAEFSKTGQVKISVSPDDYDRLEGIRLRTGEQSWSLVIDSTLGVGEVHCECGDGGVFFSPKPQLQVLDSWIAQHFPEIAGQP